MDLSNWLQAVSAATLVLIGVVSAIAKVWYSTRRNSERLDEATQRMEKWFEQHEQHSHETLQSIQNKQDPMSKDLNQLIGKINRNGGVK